MHPLTEFALTYLHEDWDEDYRDFEDVIAHFIDESSEEDRNQLADALLEIVRNSSSSTETNEILKNLSWPISFENLDPDMFLKDLSTALR